MSDNTKSKHALRAAVLCLAAAGAIAMPQAYAQQAKAIAQDQMVVVRDAQTGELRGATPEEANALQGASLAKKQAMRIAPAQTQEKYHKSGATGKRLTDDFISSAVVVRAADGSLVHECVDADGHANHAPHAANTAPTTVTE